MTRFDPWQVGWRLGRGKHPRCGELAEVFRVLRPGGRAVLNIGEQIPPGTRTRQVLGGVWIWSEDDVRRMVEQAGFTDLSIWYADASCDGWLAKAGSHLPWSQALRLVRGTKRLTAHPSPVAANKP